MHCVVFETVLDGVTGFQRVVHSLRMPALLCLALMAAWGQYLEVSKEVCEGGL